MGSFPSQQSNQVSTLPITISQLTPDSSSFLERVKQMKFNNSVFELNRVADEMKKEVNKAVSQVRRNPFIFQSVKPKAHSKSINMLEVPQKRQKRVMTEIQEKKTIHNSVIVKKDYVRCPEIKLVKPYYNKFQRRFVKKQKISSVLELIKVNKK